MPRKTLGIILSNTSDIDLGLITKEKPFATVLYGGRFRMVDFVLSNFVNSGIEDIVYFAKEPSRSLMRHLQDRRVWNLNSKYGGLDVLFQNTKDVGYTTSEIAHIYHSMDKLEGLKNKDYVIVCNNMNYIFNYDYTNLLNIAKEKDVDVVGVYKKMSNNMINNNPAQIFHVDKGYVHQAALNTGTQEEIQVDLGIYAMRVGLFKKLIHDAVAFKTSQTFQAALVNKLHEITMFVDEFEGYVGMINSIGDYYQRSMDLLVQDVSQELFYGANPILTRSRDEASTCYGVDAKIKNSIISSGCHIEGKVTNSIISRRAIIERDCEVENCLIFNNVHIKKGSRLKNMVIGKEVIIENNTELSGSPKLPYIIAEKMKI
ncbi:MAG: glucose-1-phosphate adenylyltransferase subunit GlgD [Bacilli bacterium]